MKELLDSLLFEKEIVEQLIEIDNDVMNTKYSIKDYYESISRLLDTLVDKVTISNNSLFVTEGDVLTILDILRRIDNNGKIIIYVNQNNIAMNKWLLSKYQEITGDYSVYLDTDINYNKYIDLGYKVIPMGEDALVSQVLEDFYGKE